MSIDDTADALYIKINSKGAKSSKSDFAPFLSIAVIAVIDQFYYDAERHYLKLTALIKPSNALTDSFERDVNKPLLTPLLETT